jgi:hypothetical protein
MKSRITVVSALLLSAITLSSAQANWFSNQKTNTAFNLGSVRNPTGAEIRAYRHEYQVSAQARQSKLQGVEGTGHPSVTPSESPPRSFWGLFR